MKQIEEKYICKYCIGCNEEESEEFTPKMNCKNFVSAYKNWQEKYYKNLRGENNGV